MNFNVPVCRDCAHCMPTHRSKAWELGVDQWLEYESAGCAMASARDLVTGSVALARCAQLRGSEVPGHCGPDGRWFTPLPPPPPKPPAWWRRAWARLTQPAFAPAPSTLERAWADYEERTEQLRAVMPAATVQPDRAWPRRSNLGP